MGKLICPHCGSNSFIGSVKIPVNVEVERKEDGTDDFHELSRTKTTNYEIIFCAKCRKHLSIGDLTEGFTCKECGTVTNDVDENGLCILCQARRDRKELFSLSPEELLRKYLSLEKELSRTNPNVAKGLEKVEEIKNAPAKETAEEPATQEAPVETPVEEPKPEKRRRVKKKTEEPVQDAEPAQPTEEPTPAEEPVTNDDPFAQVEQSENAPFPDRSAFDMGLPTSDGGSDDTPNDDGNSGEGDGVGMLGHNGGVLAAYSSDDEDRF